MRGIDSDRRLLFLVLTEAPDEIRDSTEIAFGRFGVRRVHQFQFKGEDFGFAAAFGGGVIFSVEQIARTGDEAGVIRSHRSVAGKLVGAGIRLRVICRTRSDRD